MCLLFHLRFGCYLFSVLSVVVCGLIITKLSSPCFILCIVYCNSRSSISLFWTIICVRLLVLCTSLCVFVVVCYMFVPFVLYYPSPCYRLFPFSLSNADIRVFAVSSTTQYHQHLRAAPSSKYSKHPSVSFSTSYRVHRARNLP